MRQQSGFTLIEMLLALMIFSLLSISGYQLLQGVLRQEEISHEKSQRIAEVQRAFATLERDFSAMLPRTVRTQGQGSTPPIVALSSRDKHTGDSITFTHANWFNPADRLARSTLQRVSYDMRQQALWRRHTALVDIPSGEQTYDRRLLSGVEGLRLRYYRQGGWQDTPDDGGQLPAAVEVTLTLTDYGALTRRFPIANQQVP